MIFPRLRVFISSRMAELAAERLVIKAALDQLKIDAWIFEENAGARPVSTQQTYFDEIDAADLYLGVFWKGYGHYTIDEYEHARSRGKDCLIYEKRTDIDGQRAPKLQEWLDQITEVENGLTIRRFNTLDEFTEFVKDDIARWQADIIRKYKAPAPTLQTLPMATGQRRDLETLRNKVRKTWIDQVLSQSIHGDDILALGKQHQSDALDCPWEAILERPAQENHVVPPGKTILDVFTEVDRSLLILGQPGSGKTTTLLQLCSSLIDHADANGLEPTPVVLHLSAWNDPGEPFADWLASELSEKYRIPKRLGRPWLEESRLTLLLDGLDEVVEERRASCVAAINTFAAEFGHAGFVVCCRVEEYSALPVQLKLNGAIALQPLTKEQILSYAAGAGPKFAALQAVLQSDGVLQEEARSPLVLSIMADAYEGKSLEELRGGELSTGDARRRHLFDAYIDRMFERRKSVGHPYARDQTISWLAWLAQRMKEHGQSIFSVEGLQPTWLTKRWQRWLNFILVRLGIGLFWGLLGGAFFETVEFVIADNGPREVIKNNGFWVWLLAVPIWTVGIGLVNRAAFTRTASRPRDLATFLWRVAAGYLAYLLLWVLVWTALLWAWPLLPGGTIGSLDDQRLVPPALAGVMIAFLLAVLDAKQRIPDEVGSVEALGWYWRPALVGAGAGALIGMTIWGVRWLALAPGPPVFYLALGIALGAFFGGLEGRVATGKTVPNQGIRLSVTTAVAVGGSAALITALVVGLTWNLLSPRFVLDYGAWPPNSVPSTITEPVTRFALIVFGGVVFWFGGLDVFKHYVLRAILVVSGVPRRLGQFLDYAAVRTFLQKVGGSYMFRHRLLLEQFAELPKRERGRPDT
jgi:hypothetical protein